MSNGKRLPPWIKARFPGGPNYRRIKGLLRGASLHTVCEEAHCPNMGECFENRTATFLILGEICTRHCGFCAIGSGHPTGLDPEEPERVAKLVQTLQLRHAVVTSVTRDDLADGGALIFSQTISSIRQYCSGCKIEVLVPDFAGSRASLARVMAAVPDILNHNIETVPRLYPQVRPRAIYTRSLELLRRAREVNSTVLTKSGLMVGLGERWVEILGVMADLRSVGCDILTVGQYLRPSPQHLTVARYYSPGEFEELRSEGNRLGFCHVEAGPLVRSSYQAHRQVDGLAIA